MIAVAVLAFLQFLSPSNGQQIATYTNDGIQSGCVLNYAGEINCYRYESLHKS